MAERYGFFDAVVTNGLPDRSYSADDINNIFKGILSDGVFRLFENALNVTAGTGISVNIDTGKAIIKDHWYLNTTATNLSMTPAHATLNRYTSAVLRFKRSDRSINLYVIDGEPASAPAVPALTQTADIYEIRLANILVGAGAVSISNDNITDTRSYTSGIVDAPTFNMRRYETTLTVDQRYFVIPAEYDYTPNTVLQVYVSGVLAFTSAYTIQVDEFGGGYMVVFGNSIRAGNTLSLVMIN